MLFVIQSVFLSSKERNLWGIYSVINKLTNEISGPNMSVWSSIELTPCSSRTCRCQHFSCLYSLGLVVVVV